ncbi:hypothetical protein MAP00_006029 [Monascus purpureus]|nr:hypothetical protein MAP00_006029 [Monascus purpureus]
MMERSDAGLEKRWFGKFLDWLKKMNTVEAGNDGFLSMAFQKSFLLYRAAKGCPRRSFYEEMKMYLDADVQMDATYAYYLSGTIVPMKVADTYGYLGVEPSAYLGLRVEGNAILTYTSEWKKLIDTLAYPWLSIKGIATVGPSLDIYGRIRGSVSLSAISHSVWRTRRVSATRPINGADLHSIISRWALLQARHHRMFSVRLNLFNQPDVYRFGSFNGYCYDPQIRRSWPAYTKCKANFVGSQFSDHPSPARWSKRGDGQEELINEDGGWEIDSIEMDLDEDA